MKWIGKKIEKAKDLGVNYIIVTTRQLDKLRNSVLFVPSCQNGNFKVYYEFIDTWISRLVGKVFKIYMCRRKVEQEEILKGEVGSYVGYRVVVSK